MTSTPKEKAFWSVAILVVLLYALIPVAWITSLSFKTGDEVSDKKFFSGFAILFAPFDAWTQEAGWKPEPGVVESGPDDSPPQLLQRPPPAG